MLLFRIGNILLLTLLLSACGDAFKSKQPAPVSNSSDLRSSRPYTVSQVVSMLQRGQEQTAKFALQQLLQKSPSDKLANKLLKQITDDPIKLYGKQSINYTIKSGDSLGKLAAKYIGDSMDFYGLARYNNIKDPRKIIIGNRIKIPVRSAKPKVSDFIRALTKAKNSKQPLAIIEVLLTKKSSLSKSERVLFDQEFSRYFSDSKQANSLSEKKMAINKLKATKATSRHKKRLIVHAEYLGYLIRANEKLKLNENLNAYDVYLKAFNLKQQPNSLDTYVNEQLTERLHRTAIIYFRDQELERAIHLWDKILKINSHEPSKKYRARATRLTTKLKSLNNE